jgi:hypothetical protein
MTALHIGSRVTVYGKPGYISGTHRRGFWVVCDDGTTGAWSRSVVEADPAAPASTEEGAARNVNLIVRSTPAEKARVQALADEAGQSVSDYIRQRIGL